VPDFYAPMRDITKQPVENEGGEDSFSLLPALQGKAQTDRKSTTRW